MSLCVPTKPPQVITRVVNEAEFQFDFLFDPLRDPKAPFPPLPKLKHYDPLVPVPDVAWSKEQVEKRQTAVDKWKKKARNYFYNRVHIVRPENDKKKPSKVGAAMNGLVRPMKARAAYQLFEVENTEDLAKDVAQQWEQRSAEVIQKEDDELARLNASRAEKGLPPRAKRDGPTIAFRQKIVRERFAELTAEEQKDFGVRAKTEASERREEYKEAMSKPIEHTPEQRQQ
ncbi:hypothetical protein CYLTODRAFT_495591 [Cylindrobasidium torrendii FP15055 ss-10]|uniref:Uncharacterized protein n=1 Tax=Cylindrobasidium torrendii FP15055 ss-10 TaxID=1314674 RepID=A0A0D7AQB2_9AGAR|nr:hypothetical protein CYLTODRAFT_495591 [Cylindrobasidium torrendii FP15055 ss-10]